MSDSEQKELFTITGATIRNKRVNLDGNRFENVTFENCTLLYRGGIFPEIHDCTVRDCTWELTGAAFRGAMYLKHVVEAGDGANVAKFLGIKEEHVTRGMADGDSD